MHLGKSREKVHRMKSRLRVMSLRIMSRLIAQLGECQASLNILPLYICNNIHDAITAAAQEFEEIRDDEMKRLRATRKTQKSSKGSFERVLEKRISISENDSAVLRHLRPPEIGAILRASF